MAAASRIDEIKAIKDKAIALELYGRQVKDKDIENWAAEIKLRASRRLGEISLELPKKAGPPKKNNSGEPRHNCKAKVLEKAGISTQDASRAEQVAAIPEKEFEEVVPKKKAKW